MAGPIYIYFGADAEKLIFMQELHGEWVASMWKKTRPKWRPYSAN